MPRKKAIRTDSATVQAELGRLWLHEQPEKMAHASRHHYEQVTFSGQTRRLDIHGQSLHSIPLQLCLRAFLQTSPQHSFSHVQPSVPPVVTSQWRRRYSGDPPATEALVGRVPLKAS